MIQAKIILALCMTAFGTVPLFVRLIPMTSAEIVFWRAILAALSIFFYMVIRKKSFNLKNYKKKTLLLILSGGLMGFNWLTLFEAYRYTTVSVATLIYYSAPLLVTLGSIVLMGEKISRFQALCMMAAALGLVLIIKPAGVNAGEQMMGMVYAFTAAVLYASVIMLNRLVRNVPSVLRTLIQFISAAAILTPYILKKGDIGISTLGSAGIISLLVLGIIHTGFIYCLYFGAIQKLKGREIAILSYIDPLAAVILSAVILKETFTYLQMIGGILILLFTFLSERGGIRKKQIQYDRQNL